MAKSLLCMLFLFGLAGSAAARTAPETATPRQIAALLACRSVTESVQRLACFDRETSGVATAIAGKDLVVIDRERVREARKNLFGFSVPSFGGLFGGGDDEVNRLDGVVAAAMRNAEGGWTIRLVDGSVWSQTDDAPVALAPKRGTKVIVKPGVFGSFKLNFDGQPSIRVKRIG